MVLEIVTLAADVIILCLSAFFVVVSFSRVKRVGEDPVAREHPGVTVIVPAHNEQETITQCVECILGLSYPTNRVRVIVVNDGSTDRTAHQARRYAHRGVHVIDLPRGGKARALNRGIAQTQTELIATLDADSLVEPDSLRRMVGHFSDPDVMAVIPRLHVFRPSNLLQKMQEAEYLVASFLQKLMSAVDATPVTPGPMSVFRTRLFEEVGPFSEDTFAEDEDIALRIHRRRYRIRYASGAVVHTCTPARLGQLIRQRIRWCRGHFQNLSAHRKLFQPQYGALAMVVLPASVAWVLAAGAILIGGLCSSGRGLYGLATGQGEAAMAGLASRGFAPLRIASFLLSSMVAYLAVHDAGRRFRAWAACLVLVPLASLVTMISWLLTPLARTGRRPIWP